MALPALLQCSGQIGSGPSWAEVRGNLSFYTAMNLASRDITVDTQSPRYWELLDVWRKIDGNPVLSQQASNQCPVGYLTLKLLGFVSLRAEVILAELLKLEGVMIHPILRCLASTLDWHKVADLGWPLFRSPAHNELGMTNPLNTWSEANWLSEMPYLELVQRHLDEGIAVPAAASGLLLSYPDRISPYSRATALLALAEVLRPPRVAPDLVGEAERLIRRAVYILSEDFLAPKYPPLVPLTSHWPIFQLADRLACKGEVRWNLPAQAARSRPRIAVLPMPEKVSDVARKRLHLVEVGANLGDCTFWAAAHLGRRFTSATAVEPVPSAAAAVRRSVTINGWDFIQVLQTVAGAKAGQGSMHFLAHSAGNPYASASAVPLRNVETPSVPVRMTTVAHLLSSQPRPGTARLLKLYAYADLLDVLKGTRSAARKVDAVWLAFAAGLLPRPRSTAVAMFAFFYRQGFRVALPSFEVDWCRSWRPRWVAEQKMRQWLAATQTSRSAHSMVYVVAFRPRVLHCKPWQSFKQHADETRVWDRAGIASGCFFGRSRRQLLMAKRHRATYASYFLGDEELELEQQIREENVGTRLDFFHDSDGDIHPPQLPFEDDDRAQRWFHRKLKSKDGSKIRAKLCNKLAQQLQGMGHELIGRDAIERVSEALTQGTAEEGPLVCRYRLGEARCSCGFLSSANVTQAQAESSLQDGMKVAVQVLDGKLLIHGYFEGSLVHPVRIPILAFLTEHGKTSEKQPEDDCDLFGQAAPATGGRADTAALPLTQPTAKQGAGNPSAEWAIAIATGMGQEGVAFKARRFLLRQRGEGANAVRAADLLRSHPDFNQLTAQFPSVARAPPSAHGRTCASLPESLAIQAEWGRMVAELEGATDLVDLTGRVKEVFGRYRADDRRNFLTRPEMQRMLNDLMPNTGYKLLDKLLKEIDGDGADGKFTTPEFVDWLVGKAGLSRQAQRVVLRAIVEATGDSLGARVMEMFDRYDLDGSCFLERHELMKVLRVLDSEITTAEIQRVLEELDTSGDGRVSYKEFLAWLHIGGSLARKLSSKLKQVTGPVREKKVKDAFNLYDVSGDGFLDISELRNAMGKMFLFNQDEVNKICADLDTSNDGVISYKEFSIWMRKGSTSKEVLKGKTILAPIDSDGLDAVFYVFCGPGKTEMEMKDFVKFCKNCKFVDSTLPPAVADLVFNDHRVKPHGRRTIDFFEFAVALELLAERRNAKVSDLHTVALLTGGPQAQLKGAAVETAAKGVAKKMKPILDDKEGWKRDVENSELWKKFGIGTSAGRCLRQIYCPSEVSQPTPPCTGLPHVRRSSAHLQKFAGFAAGTCLRALDRFLHTRTGER
eukprot:s82_g18.t4